MSASFLCFRPICYYLSSPRSFQLVLFLRPDLLNLLILWRFWFQRRRVGGKLSIKRQFLFDFCLPCLQHRHFRCSMKQFLKFPSWSPQYFVHLLLTCGLQLWFPPLGNALNKKSKIGKNLNRDKFSGKKGGKQKLTRKFFKFNDFFLCRLRGVLYVYIEFSFDDNFTLIVANVFLLFIFHHFWFRYFLLFFFHLLLDR